MSTPEAPKLLPGIRPHSVEIRRISASIAACRERVEEYCSESLDSRLDGVVYRADMAVAAERRWRVFGGHSPLAYLRDVRRELLLRELEIKGEPVHPGESSLRTMQRTDAHVRLEETSVLPFAAHLRQIQDLPLAALTGT